jgi:hypothetical protein
MMDSRIPPIDYLTSYIEITRESMKISPADFGLKTLHKGINTRDAESVIKNLHTTKYKHQEIQNDTY